MGALSFTIKAVQVLMLLAGLAAFLYGAYQLGMDLLFLLRGVPVEGIVTGHRVESESRKKFVDGFETSSMDNAYTEVEIHRPTIHYRFPVENGKPYTHYSSIWYEGAEVDRYQTGSRVMIRVLPGSPEKARLPGAFTHYLWATTAFVAGLFALVVVSSLFFLHEAMLGRDLSPGLSLFRSVNWPTALAVTGVAILGFIWIHTRYVPWLGPREFMALVTGEMWMLPSMLAARGEPPPGRHLNEAEASLARMPVLGTAFADTAMDQALLYGLDQRIQRYLAALADPQTVFPLRSVRALAYAAEKGNAQAVEVLLASGIHPDTALMEGEEPIRRAAYCNQAAVILQLMAAGARTEYPAYPLIVSAIEGRAGDAALLLLERVPYDPAWRQPHTNLTLADLALLNGLAGPAAVLLKQGVPSTLPQFFPCVVADDPEGLERVLPRDLWTKVNYEYAALLHLAARYHGMKLARQLLDMGADPNERIFDEASLSRTPLIEAVLAGDTDMVRFLASWPGIRLDQGDATHVPPLGHAVAQGRWDLAEVLGDKGASVNCTIGDHDGNTPLHIAAAAGDVRRVRWLLSRGADRTYRNFRELTAFDVAVSAEVAEIMEGH
ncbi:MAG TPA: ankyrin repeat domain-containing protein [Deltaproteobacteria bacterium]|nr:ankyrin repeat domain-containing protein [Deltaproteobacteria bacterium]